MNWPKYFEMMVDWKSLPAYRTEPRIDSLIGYFLKDIMSGYLDDTIIGIIPELPIRLATVYPDHEGTNYADRSYKVDFYLLGSSDINYLIEFKTDSGSRREEQDKYLFQAQSVGMKSLVNGICQIASVSSYKKKYDYLLKKMKRIGILNEENCFSGNSDEIQIIYIQPQNKNEENRCVDFQWISKWLDQQYGSNEFESELSKTLMQWSKD